MYDDDKWETTPDDQIEELFYRINPVDGLYPVSLETTSVRIRSLPFYEEVLLVRLTDPNWEQRDLTIYYLFLDDTLYRLNGRAYAMQEVNSVAPLKLTESNVLDYVRFFTFFVRSDEGPFIIVEHLENKYLPQDMDDNLRNRLTKHIRPAEIEMVDEEGTFFCKAPVLYGPSLSVTQFEVKLTGEIEMLDYQPIIADLPPTSSAPIA